MGRIGVNGFIRLIAFVSVLMGSLARASAEDILLVVGAPGTTEYGNEFSEWQKRWESIANTAQLEMKVIGPGGSGEDDDRTLLANEIETQVESNGSNPLWLIFVGHGTWDGISARFNLVGPDVDARELAKMLKPCKRPLVVVNCTSSSGPFIDRLSGAGRVVVTATKSGSEQNFARFGGYFAQALSEPGSDLDHDDAVSVREAFLKAATQTGVFYEQEGRIATEHAMIDDNGDKKGSRVELLRGTKKLSGEASWTGNLRDGSRFP